MILFRDEDGFRFQSLVHGVHFAGGLGGFGCFCRGTRAALFFLISPQFRWALAASQGFAGWRFSNRRQGLDLRFAELDRCLGDVFLEPFGVGAACEAGDEGQRSLGEVKLDRLEVAGRPGAKAERVERPFQLAWTQCQQEVRRESEESGEEETLKFPDA